EAGERVCEFGVQQAGVAGEGVCGVGRVAGGGADYIGDVPAAGRGVESADDFQPGLLYCFVFGGVTGDDIGVGGEVAGSGGEGEGGGRSGLSLPVGVCAAGGDRKQAGGGCGAAGVEGGREVDNGV